MNDALVDQVAGDLIGAAIEFPIAQDRAIGDDGVTLGETGTVPQGRRSKLLARLPPHGVVVLATILVTKSQRNRFHGAAQRIRELVRRAQRHDRRAEGAVSVLNYVVVDAFACGLRSCCWFKGIESRSMPARRPHPRKKVTATGNDIQPHLAGKYTS